MFAMKESSNMNENYYDTFVNSILSLPPKLRTSVLNQAMLKSEDNNPYLYLWNAYNDLDNEYGEGIAKILDDHSLAID